jgi:hypothetical protein
MKDHRTNILRNQQWWALKRRKHRIIFKALIFLVKSTGLVTFCKIMLVDFIVALNFSILSLLILSLPCVFQNYVRCFYRSDKIFKTWSVSFIVAMNFSKLNPLFLS